MLVALAHTPGLFKCNLFTINMRPRGSKKNYTHTHPKNQNASPTAEEVLKLVLNFPPIGPHKT